MIGGGINASRITHFPAKIKSGPIHEAFQLLIFKDNGVTVHSPEYAPYYPVGLKLSNIGGLHLVSPKFIAWAIELMKFIITCYDDEKVVLNRGEFIVVSMQKLKNDKVHFDAFAQVFRTTRITIADYDLRKIYLRIAEHAFRAYTKEENNRRFNGIKALASDNTNMAFRAQVQSRCIGSKTKSECPSNRPTTYFDHIRKELGMRPEQQRQLTRTDEEGTREYREQYTATLKSLLRNQLDPQRA